jgi:6-phosphogluconolactonase
MVDLLRLALALTGLAVPSPAAAPSGKPVAVYVGTFSDRTSRGIYRFEFDPATGAASTPVLAAEMRKPSFLERHPNGGVLYAVGEDANQAGIVRAYAIAAGGELRLLNEQSSSGAGPNHLVADRAGKGLIVANYRAGSVVVLPLQADGRLGPVSSVLQHQGSGPDPSRQDKPHAHGVYLDAAQHFVLSPDLGADRVFVHRYAADEGRLEPHGAAALEPGSGPRHLAFDPSGRHVYVINELSQTITVFAYDAAAGSLTALDTVSTRPAGFTGTNATAEVALSADGRFAYGSNRGHDSVAVFRVEKDGRLLPAGHVPAGGRTPRHFAIDPSGQWLLVAHQDSDSIAVFRLDPQTGLPAPTGVTVAVPEPVCLLFTPR